MVSILYDSRIDWDALKQRPQYLAEELAKQYKVVFTCMRLYRGKTINQISNQNLIVKHFNHIPFLDRYKYTKLINDYLRKRYYKSIIKKNNPKIIILSDATKISIIRGVYKGPIIYDCMDDFVSFEEVANTQREEIIKCEERVIKESVFTLVSSANLMNTIIKRYGEGIRNKLLLVRNGCNISDLPMSDMKKERKKKYIICYFGTIGTWFDIDILKKSLDDFSNIEYVIIGNVKPGISFPNDERIKLIDSVPHNMLATITQECDAFVMPFLVNDVVLSVDPVKLYEYISLGKNILCVKYPEVERFADFVYLYEDYNSFKKQLIFMMNNQELKYDKLQRELFLESNNWQSRGEQVIEAISQYL